MIKHSAFEMEPWKIQEMDLDLERLAQTESVFALSNGHIGLRGNLDEGEPNGIPGTYLNSVYEQRTLPYAEEAYGYPESGQTVINITNGKLIRLLVDDEPFDVRYGKVLKHERELDFRAGVLRRDVEWTSPANRSVRVSSVRMVSFTQRAIVAISYEVEPLNGPARIVIQSELVTNEAPPDLERDPRAGVTSLAPLEGEEHLANGTTGLLIHHTKASGLRIGAAMEHTIEGKGEITIESESTSDIARTSIIANLKKGERLRVTKFIAYGWSKERSRPAIHDQVMAALSAARVTGWEGLLAEQRAYLDEFWNGADVEIEGDLEIQQAARFALFHILQASARVERRSIPAKGLTGPGYDGHVFWDTEAFVLPLLTMTVPNSAADALRWRHATLPLAQENARKLGLKGAAFPWRTIQGEECSGYWPAGTAAFHVNADIAYAVTNYLACTGDTAFEKETGLVLLVETARLWHSLGFTDATNHFRIDGVTGPDEYSALVDNNVYTNLMAQRNLRAAAAVAERYPDTARELGVNTDEIRSWRAAAENMFIPYNEHLRINPQDDSFTKHAVWDFAATKADQYPLLLSFPYFDLYRKQVIKQADLVLAMYLCSEAFTPELKARNFAYYEPLTVRDSSLSASTQAVIAAEVGQMQLAYDYLGEAALMDLDDLEHNTRNGLHIASLAGVWSALVAGFGGMRMHGNSLSFSPRLPEGIKKLTFRLTFREHQLHVEVNTKKVTYSLLKGKSLTIHHNEHKITLSQEEPVSRDLEAIKAGPCPAQPAGRAPATRGTHHK